MVKDIHTVDVLVIGGGVVGSAILWELARYAARVVLLERNPDVCEGTSKSNSAIVHTGFDAPPGTLEARLLADARELWPQVIEHLHIPYLQTGALLIATSDEELATLQNEIIPKAERNGVRLSPLTREEILENAPYINPAILGGALVEGEGIIDPFWTTRAYCENAVLNGAQVFTGESVIDMSVAEERIFVSTSGGKTFVASLVVNAAGLWSDEVARLAGDHSFTLTPRKGQFIIIEEDHGVSQIILPIPNRISKGILVTPIMVLQLLAQGYLPGKQAIVYGDAHYTGVTAQRLEDAGVAVSRISPAQAQLEVIEGSPRLQRVTLRRAGELYYRTHHRKEQIHVAR